MPLPDELSGDSWSRRVGRAIFPWLVWCARNHKTLFYSDLDDEIVHRKLHHHVNFVMYGYPAGVVGNAVLEIAEAIGEDVPPLNAIIVAKTGPHRGIPGDGCDWYLQRFLDRKIDFERLGIEDKRAIVSDVHDAVFSFQHWDRVEAYLRDVLTDYPELKTFNGKFLSIKKEGSKTHKVPAAISWDFSPSNDFVEPNGAESVEHQTLKEYIAEHPEVIGLPPGTKPQLEKVLGSGDRADVYFTTGDKLVVAEIKSNISPVVDICKGVFQCVKYKAILRAHQRLKRVIPNGDAILVVGKAMPIEATEVADNLGIRWIDQISPR